MSRSFIPAIYLLMMQWLSFPAWSQPSAEYNDRWVRRQFADIADGLRLARHETTNAEYRQFLRSLLDEGRQDEYLRCLPDTQAWSMLGTQALPMVRYYFRHPAYDGYPVVGLTRESVDAYLRWLTATYRRNGGTKYADAEFCLPTREEWIRAAQGGDTSKTYPWGSGFIKNSRGEDLCNYRPAELTFDSLAGRWLEVPAKTEPVARFTSRVDGYFPNAWGLLNMSGNVAEMIDRPGVAMGGSFRDPAWQVRTNSTQEIGAPAPWQGFRVALRQSSGRKGKP